MLVPLIFNYYYNNDPYTPPLPPFPMSGLIAGYHMDGNANDYVGSNNGTAAGGTVYNNYFGLKNQGTCNTTVEIPNNSIFQFTTQMSVSVWMSTDKTASTQANAMVVSKPEPSFGNGFYINLQSSSNQLQISTAGLTPDLHTITSAGIYDNSWHNIVVTLGSNVLNVYVDGSAIPVYTSPVTGSMTVTGESVFLGSFDNLFTFNGFWDEVNFWNRPLTAQEVSDLFGSYGPIQYIESFGDSIMQGSAASHYYNGWMYLVANSLGYKLHNHAVSGTTLESAIPVDVGGTPNMWDNRNNIPAYDSTKAFLFISHMMNDWGMNFPAYTSVLYESQDKDILDVAISKGWPLAKIKRVGGFYWNPSTAPSYYVTNYGVPIPPDSTRDTLYRAAAQSAASSRGVQFIDVRTAMINGGGYSLLGDNTIHPNDAGHVVAANEVLNNL